MSEKQKIADGNQKIALLIDCDNASANVIGGVLAELAKYGQVNVRHAHGNWRSTRIARWRTKLIPHAIRPMQQFPYTKGKNATDIALMIDAMDLLHSKIVNAFAIMTSDSDFTPLALRIRESGFPVYGFGVEQTPEAFVKACFTFIHTDKLAHDEDEKSSKAEETSAKVAHDEKSTGLQKKSADELIKDAELVELLTKAVEQTAGDDGWSYVGTVGSYIANNSPFSPVNYGYQKLGELILATGLFQEKMRNDGTAMYVMRKTTKSN